MPTPHLVSSKRVRGLRHKESCGHFLPVDLPAVEGLCVECHGGRVPGLGTIDVDLPSKLHPWDSEDRAGVGTGQREDIVFPMVQEPKHTSRRDRESGQQEQAESVKDGNTQTQERPATNAMPPTSTELCALLSAPRRALGNTTSKVDLLFVIRADIHH